MIFKVGDWVRSTKYLHMVPCKVESIFESNERKGDFGLKSCGTVHYASEAELWQPKEGEWVVLCDKDMIDEMMFGVIKYSKELYEEIISNGNNPIIEPFIGKLPTFVKDNT